MEQHPQTIAVDASLFYCAFCRKSLKLPTFKCDAGHVVCDHYCAGHLRVCTDAAQSCNPCPDVDSMILAVPLVPCVNKDRGCTARVASHESADHLRSCPFVPCKCPLEDCGFPAPPAALLDHFYNEHGCAVVRKYIYGKSCKLPVADPDRPGIVAALAGKSDGCLFVVYGLFLPGNDAMRVSVVCLRASEDAPEVASQFRCKLCVKDVRALSTPPSFTFRVPSSDGSRLLVTPDSFLAVPHLELGKWAHFTICIHKDGGEAA